MDLYFAPLACSMATRIALYEAGADAQYIYRDRNKRLPDGSDFLQINPLGMVPTLRTDEGDLLTENGAILQYVAARFPAANLAPRSGVERARLQQWLSFIGTEFAQGDLHSAARPQGAGEAKAYAAGLADARFGILEKHLAGPRIPARHIQHRGRVPRHGAELDARGADRPREMAEREGLSQPHPQAAEHRARLGRRARALYRGAGAPQSGVMY
jgi:glutathione S-transferase